MSADIVMAKPRFCAPSPHQVEASGAIAAWAGDDKLCLRNNRRLGLRNGTLWTVLALAGPYAGFINMMIEGEDGEVDAPVEGFDATDAKELPGDPFTYGYSITAHKSQGSQWPRVLVFDESRFFRANRWRWLYTAITEAVTVVRR